MKPQVKQLWIRALESGQYKQGKSTLLNINPQNGEECFCVLGVLTDLYRKVMDTGTWNKRESLLDGETPFMVGGSSMDFISLPTVVQDWAGIWQVNPEVVIDGKSTSISKLNDDGVTFPELAKIIATYL